MFHRSVDQPMSEISIKRQYNNIIIYTNEYMNNQLWFRVH